MKCLRGLSCSAVDEVSSNGYPDIVFTKDNVRVVLQIKIGAGNLLDGVAEVERHARELECENKAVIAYPESIRREIPEDAEDDFVEELALNETVEAISLTEFLTGRLQAPAWQVLETVVESIRDRESEYHPEVAIQTLREGVDRLVIAIRQSSDDFDLITNAVIGHFELFTALGQEAADVDEEQLSTAALDLTAYVLINQMLFYRMYSRTTDRVRPFETVHSPEELDAYFTQIEAIDYAPIYSVDVLSHIPSTRVIQNALWAVSDAIIGLRPELMRHDLIGRLFHELLPPDTRKLLAAFYTRPVAAEMLAELAIDDGNEKVADLACGSGTLLVSAYGIKKRLLGRRNPRLHRRFVEDELTGVDIMPFATHLAALNLTAQNLQAPTEQVRVGCCDSLTLTPATWLKPFMRQLQFPLDDVPPQTVPLNSEGRPDSFQVGAHDTILMNPPFTKWTLLPQQFRDSVAKRWSRHFHKAAGLWAPFMLLGDAMLNEGGKLGLVIPINFLRGQRTDQLREYFFRGRHTCRYIVKPVNNYGFTEGAEYRDILVVLEKRPPRKAEMTGVVLLKAALHELTLHEAQEIAAQIRRANPGADRSYDAFDIYWVEHEELEQRRGHLQHLVSISNLRTREVLLNFVDDCGKNAEVAPLPSTLFREGYRPVPKGTAQFVFITRPIEESRLEQAMLVLDDEDKKAIRAHAKKVKWGCEFRREDVLPSLRTTTGLPRMDITGLHDYAIITAYPELDRILALSSFRGRKDDIDWDAIQARLRAAETHLVVQHRINPYSPTTRFIAFYSDLPIYPSNVSEVVTARDPRQAKALCVFFNSTYFWAQFFFHKEESTGRQLNIRVADLTQILFPDVGSLSDKQLAPLLSVFEELGTEDFPSLMDQLESGYEGRKAIDRAVLDCLGAKGISDGDLAEVYEELHDEMLKIRRLSKD